MHAERNPRQIQALQIGFRQVLKHRGIATPISDVTPRGFIDAFWCSQHSQLFRLGVHQVLAFATDLAAVMIEFTGTRK